MDVSVVVPSHNGSGLLADTLGHIAAQRPPEDLHWEVVVVDNASVDGTAAAARDAWPATAGAPMRVVHEPRLGLGHAHARGFGEAAGGLVAWIEDDNRIAPDWLEVVTSTMGEHPEVGACGGFNEPLCEASPPAWFDRFQSSYAAGPQGAGGDVTETRGFLWGAGLTVRRAAWEELSRSGFSLALPDRRGSRNFNSGGDSEICFALRLQGWRLWYEPRLRLRHFLAAHRLNWAYLRRLHRGFGASSVGLDRFYRAFEGGPLDGRRRTWLAAPRVQPPALWLGEAGVVAAQLARRTGSAWRARRDDAEGDAEVLELEWELGRLSELLRMRGAYDRSLDSLAHVPWRQRPPTGRA